MINNLVDYGKIETGLFGADFQEFDILELLLECFQLFE